MNHVLKVGFVVLPFALSLGACARSENPLQPSSVAVEFNTNAKPAPPEGGQPSNQPPAPGVKSGSVKLNKGGVLNVLIDGANVGMMLELTGSHGFSVSTGGGGAGQPFHAMSICDPLSPGCAPGTDIPLFIWLYDGNQQGTATLQGRTFEVGGMRAGTGDVGWVSLELDGTARAPSTEGTHIGQVVTVRAPFTGSGFITHQIRSDDPVWSPQNRVEFDAHGQALLTLEWMLLAGTGDGTMVPAWGLRSATYLFE
jgi:hypothetical protein